MKMSYIRFIGLFALILLLSGCMYPKSELKQNEVPNDAQVNTVQMAIDQYREETGGPLPIKTKTNETPLFEKYLIDFNMLTNEGLLTEIPGNAFEKGGYYQYALYDVEEDPTVKLIDLRTSEQIRSINIRVDSYRSEHTYPPFGEQVIPGVHQIDADKIDLEAEPTVDSPYSEHKLPLLITGDGKLLIDYRKDIYEMLQAGDIKVKPGEDLLAKVAEQNVILPAYSHPLTVDDENEPILK